MAYPPTDIVVIEGVTGLALDADHFRIINLLVTSGQWTGGRAWVWGTREVVHQHVPVPLEARVVRRQILRNLEGKADV